MCRQTLAYSFSSEEFDILPSSVSGNKDCSVTEEGVMKDCFLFSRDGTLLNK